LAGILHPRLRTLLLPQELANKAGTQLRVRVGEPLPSQKLRSIDSDALLCTYLRLKTYALSRESVRAEAPDRRALEPVSAAVDPRQLEAEIAALPEETLLLTSGKMQVRCARAAHIPRTLQELGRLRELTFRAVGEGTGRSADIDVFDDYYEHLFIWNA